jgi:thiosulfate/3-mercaptopyruvate sulfurtransferase
VIIDLPHTITIPHRVCSREYKNANQSNRMYKIGNKGDFSMTRKNRIALVCALLFFCVLSVRFACSQQASQMLVTTDWLAAHMKDANLVILYIGNDRRAYYARHIPNAQFVALRDIARMNPGGWLELPPVNSLKTVLEQAGVGDHSRIVLYGDSKGMFAARAYFTLDFLGLGRRTALLDGGLEKWAAERQTLSTEVVASHPATLTVVPHPRVIADLSTVQKASSTRTVPIIDARAPTEFAGTKGGTGTGRTGHIPGAKDVFWGDNLAGASMPVLKPVAAIRARYVAAGLKPEGKEIVYCHGGMQASYDYFTLKLAGFHPVLYAGSFSEWTSAFGTQVEISEE